MHKSNYCFRPTYVSCFPLFPPPLHRSGSQQPRQWELVESLARWTYQEPLQLFVKSQGEKFEEKMTGIGNNLLFHVQHFLEMCLLSLTFSYKSCKSQLALIPCGGCWMHWFQGYAYMNVVFFTKSSTSGNSEGSCTSVYQIRVLAACE